MKIHLTKLEANAIWQTANQMKDDMGYYSFMGKAKQKKFIEAYESAMDKLLKIIHSSNGTIKTKTHD